MAVGMMMAAIAFVCAAVVQIEIDVSSNKCVQLLMHCKHGHQFGK